MNWKSNFKKGKEIIIATSSKDNVPNANIVISMGFTNDKLLVADCQMNNTIKNLKKNKNVCVLGGYFRINGKVNIYSSGKYFELCVKNNPDYKVNHAILITINNVFDLNKVLFII
jgi:hypothetical protein